MPQRAFCGNVLADALFGRSHDLITFGYPIMATASHGSLCIGRLQSARPRRTYVTSFPVNMRKQESGHEKSRQIILDSAYARPRIAAFSNMYCSGRRARVGIGGFGMDPSPDDRELYRASN